MVKNIFAVKLMKSKNKNEYSKDFRIGDLNFEEIVGTECQILELYRLFKQRSKVTKISANSELEYNKHVEFVENHPYRYWFLIRHNEVYIGTVYLTDLNSMGLSVEDKYIYCTEKIITLMANRFDPLPAKPSVRRASFHMNIGRENQEFEKILINIGAEIMQKSYVLPIDVVSKSKLKN